MAARTAAATGSATRSTGQPIEPEQRRAGDRRRRQRGRAEPPGRCPPRRSRIRSREPGLPRAEHAAAQDDVRVAAREVEPPDHRAGHRDDLVGEAVDDRAARRRRRPSAAANTTGDSSPMRRSRDAARVHRRRQRGRRRAGRNAPGRSRSSRVRGPRPSRARTAAARPSQPTSVPPPQSPEMLAERVQPDGAAIRRDAGGVHALAADDDDAPAPVGARAQGPERVVEEQVARARSRGRRARRVSARTSAGVSAPASVYTATSGAIAPGPPAWRRPPRPAPASRSIPAPTPTAWCELVGPRTAASRRPSSATSATSVFEFPPSTARTLLTPSASSRTNVAARRRAGRR